jgi:hypothetical protein
MAILKKYSEEYHKDGYYVHASISGAKDPITLQASKATLEVYQHLGYHPDQDNGETRVPKDLTWNLYDVDLHWTEGAGGPKGIEERADVESDEEGPPLTQGHLDQLEILLDDYEGIEKEKIESLLDNLKSNAQDLPQPDEEKDTPGPLGDLQRKLWYKSDRDLEEIQSTIAGHIEGKLNKDQVSAWDVSANIFEYEPEESPNQALVNLMITHIGDEDDFHAHSMFICEEHGIEHWQAASTYDANWSTRGRLENHRALLVESLIEASNEFGFDIGAPSDKMTMDIRMGPLE